MRYPTAFRGCKPIIIIGAARSGTKLLRDLLAEHPSIDKVPYDVNYIWRLGNEKLGHDELTPEMVSAKNRETIRRSIVSFHGGSRCLIEKTVSNCLRVEFIESIFPEALYIHLVRHGEDVVESSFRQWLAPPDWGYIFQKARAFPILGAFGYGVSYAIRMVKKVIFMGKKNVGTWGPRYEGIDEDLTERTLIEVCAIQWAKSVLKALEGLADLPSSKVHTVRYEEFVRNPSEHLKNIAEFCGIDPEPYANETILKKVMIGNIGKGGRALSEEDRALMLSHIKPAMDILGYTLHSNPEEGPSDK